MSMFEVSGGPECTSPSASNVVNAIESRRVESSKRLVGKDVCPYKSRSFSARLPFLPCSVIPWDPTGAMETPKMSSAL